MNYISTCQPPTAVTASVSGFFGGKNNIYLAVAKFTRLELYGVIETGLEAITQINVYGKITNLCSFRLKKESKDSILMLTESLNISILYYDSIRHQIVTRCSGTFNDRLRKCDMEDPIMRVDPNNNFALVYVFSGMIKIIALDYRHDGILNMYNVRLNELHSVDINFLFAHSVSYLHIGVIYKDRLSKNFRSYLLRLKDMELRDGPLALQGIDENSTIVLPRSFVKPCAAIISNQTITVLGSHDSQALSPPAFLGQFPITLATQVSKGEPPSYVLADKVGNLFALSLNKTITLTFLGCTTQVETLSYIDKGVFFIGSFQSDSKLIKINKVPIDGSYITTLETFINIGPIVDMELFDRQKQSVPRLITCSGAEKWGSLRILTNGVQINTIETLPLVQFSTVFPLKLKMPGDGLDDALLFSKLEKTLVITEEDNTFRVFKGDCFIYDSTTIYAGNVVNSQILQVTRHEIRLIRLKDMEMRYYQIKTSNPYVCCSCNGWQFVVCLRYKVMLYNISDSLELLGCFDVLKEISCVSIYALSFDGSGENGIGPPTVLAISYVVNPTLDVYTLPDFSLIASEEFDQKIIFLSLQFVEFKPKTVYLFAGTGDGDLFHYEIKPGCSLFSTRTKSHLGTCSLILTLFRTNGSSLHQDLIPDGDKISNFPPLGQLNIFTCSNTPSIIHYNVFKVGYSYTNKQNITYCCSFNSKFYQECLIMMSDFEVGICKISEVSNYNVVSIPIYEAPSKIAYQPEKSAFGVLTIRRSSQDLHNQYMSLPYDKRPFSLRTDAPHEIDNKCVFEYSNLVIVNEDTMQPTVVHHFPANEIACSILSCLLADRTTHFFAVGTGIITDVNEEASSGRVMLFQYGEKDLISLTNYLTVGAVLGLVENKGFLICCVNYSVLILSLRSDDELVCLHEIGNHVTSICCKKLDDTLIVGDLIRSLTVYRLDDDGDDMSLAGKSSEISWLITTEIIDKNTFVYSTMGGCVILATLDTESSEQTTLNSPNLVVQISLNVGQQINVFRRGLMIDNKGNISHNTPKILGGKIPILFGCVSGMIGMLLEVPSPWDDTLLNLHTEILKKISSVGDIDYETWRHSNQGRLKINKPLIDGDLLEGFLNLHVGLFTDLLTKFKGHFSELTPIDVKIDQVTAYIGDLIRYH